MLKDKFIKISQAPPPMAAPPMAAPPMAAPPMAAPPMAAPIGVGAPATQPMSADATKKPITVALDTLGKILYDADITEQIENESGSDADQLTMRLWEQYGGNEKGGVVEDHVGERTSEPIPEQQIEQEDKVTEDARWKRLPQGKTIADITNLEEIRNVMNGLAIGTIKNIAKESGGAAPPGGMPPMASKAHTFVKLAQYMDLSGEYALADIMDSNI